MKQGGEAVRKALANSILGTISPRILFCLTVGASVALYLLLQHVFWVGFLGSDDSIYWSGAAGWLQHVPYLGHDHWTLRHTLVVPMAIARRLFGDNIVSMFLPTLFYGFGVIAVLGWWTWRVAGHMAAIAALILVVTDPQFVLYSSTADIDIVELFFVVAAFAVFASVIRTSSEIAFEQKQVGRAQQIILVAVGALLGFAMLSRETSAFAIVTLGILFGVGFGVERRLYFLIAAGFATVIGIELLYLWQMSGHFFYRYLLDAHHDNNINRWADQGAAIPYINPLIDPFTMLLLNHNFGLISWIGVPLAVWLARRKNLKTEERTLLVLLGSLSLVWALLAAFLWTKLVLIPRYYLLPSIGVSVLAGLSLCHMWRDGRKWLSAALAALLILGNVLALTLDNRNYMVGEYTLVHLAAEYNKTIHTDKQTLRRASLLLEWAGLRNRVTAAPPTKDDLYFYNPLRSGLKQASNDRWQIIDQRPVPLSGGRWFACNLPKSLVFKSMTHSSGCHSLMLQLYRVG